MHNRNKVGFKMPRGTGWFNELGSWIT